MAAVGSEIIELYGLKRLSWNFGTLELISIFFQRFFQIFTSEKALYTWNAAGLIIDQADSIHRAICHWSNGIRTSFCAFEF